MRRIYLFIIIIGFGFSSCSKSFLNDTPIGELSETQVQTPDNLEGLVVSAYSVLNGQFDEASNAFNSPASNWSFGDVVSDDAYKGGGGTGDQNQIHLMEIFQTNPSIIDVDRKWLALYEGVKRANLAIRELNKSETFDPELKKQRIAEMRFLRGHYYFELKKIYNHIPWIDETDETTDSYYKSNTELTSDQLWQKILDDFDAAYKVLPADQSAEPARPTKWAARAYMAKCYIFMQDWNDAITAADDVINSGKYHLMDNFRDVFLPDNDNGPEVVFAVQNSINDGSPNNYNGSIGDRLLTPGGPYPNYGFLRPSQNLVNSFKTDASGMPVEDNVNVTDNDYVDPRLDHTVGRHGIPYLDMGIYDWEPRDPVTYGEFIQKKRQVSKNSPAYLQVWPYVTSMNYYIIRYADVLLWRAEAAIETGDLETGRTYINMVRGRAKNSEVVKLDDGTPAANYNIDTYNTPFADKAEATTALRTERRLEFALEGHRFFDLVRWGVADSVMNNYFAVEKTRRTHLSNAHFTAGKNEYDPIPQAMVDLGKGMITQNPGY